MTTSLNHFIEAQEPVYEIAMRELARGKKNTHWMWYIFPQLRGLGSSEISIYYGIRDIAEARSYLQHPVLSARLKAGTQSVLKSEMSPTDIFGEIDSLKFSSCMTLFAAASDENSVYAEALKTCANADLKTLKLLRSKV